MDAGSQGARRVDSPRAHRDARADGGVRGDHLARPKDDVNGCHASKCAHDGGRMRTFTECKFRPCEMKRGRISRARGSAGGRCASASPDRGASRQHWLGSDARRRTTSCAQRHAPRCPVSSAPLPSGPSPPQRGAQGPHERHPGHPQLRRCAPRSSAARVEGIFLARCRSSGGRRAARRGDGASRARRASPRPPDLSLLRASETRPAPSVPAAHPRSPPDVLSRPSRSGSQRAPQGGLPLARPHQPPELEGGARAPPPRPSRRRVSCPSRTPPSRLIARLRPAPAPRLRVTSARAPSRH